MGTSAHTWQRGGEGGARPPMSRAGVASRLQFSSAFMAGHLSASDECVLSLEMVRASARLWTLERLGMSVILCRLLLGGFHLCTLRGMGHCIWFP